MSQSHIVSSLFFLVLVLVLLVLPSPHSARPLVNDDFAAATHLALPTVDELRLSPEKRSGALPCEMGLAGKYPGTDRLAGRYRALHLNHVLPKGTTPPSGPSKGINSLNN